MYACTKAYVMYYVTCASFTQKPTTCEIVYTIMYVPESNIQIVCTYIEVERQCIIVSRRNETLHTCIAQGHREFIRSFGVAHVTVLFDDFAKMIVANVLMDLLRHCKRPR